MAHRPAAAVVRFSSLGDVLLAAHVPDMLREQDPGRRVLFVTKDRFADILRGHPSIDRLYALAERSPEPPEAAPWVRGGLGDLIHAMRRDGVDSVVDLHRNWRSSRVVGAFPGARRILAPKYGIRRRAWVYARWLRPSPVPPILSTYRTALGLGPGGPIRPWLRDALSPEELGRGADRVVGSRAERFALLVAGARWETKRWPAEQFVRLREMIERSLGVRALIAAVPGERAHVELEGLLPVAGREILGLPFRELAAVAAHAAAIVSNDSAALHLGPALGVPVVGIFGGTVPEFGFGRQTPRDEVAEIALGCRPCSVHGRPRCPLGHHACMRRLTPEQVLPLVARALARTAEVEAVRGGSG